MPVTLFSKKIPTDKVVEPAVTPPGEKASQLVSKPKLDGSTPKKKNIPAGLWRNCPKCGEMIFERELAENLKVCFHCDHHLKFSAHERIESIVDQNSFQEIDPDMTAVDILGFHGAASYKDKLESTKQRTGLKDAVITGTGTIGGKGVALGVMNFAFLGGSMGSVVGEKLTRLIEKGTKENLPVIIFSTSGGARMYEGMFSLMQMAKTSAALAYHAKKKLPYISVLTDPTTAGVMASYASLGDLIIAEPGAMVGFAGPRVIKDTTQAELPPGFQTAEFLMDRGLIDAIVPRSHLREQLAFYIDFMMSGRKS